MASLGRFEEMPNSAGTDEATEFVRLPSGPHPLESFPASRPKDLRVAVSTLFSILGEILSHLDKEHLRAALAGCAQTYLSLMRALSRSLTAVKAISRRERSK